jgi:hypothetical protein
MPQSRAHRAAAHLARGSLGLRLTGAAAHWLQLLGPLLTGPDPRLACQLAPVVITQRLMTQRLMTQRRL